MPKINPYIEHINRVRHPYSPVDRPRLHASERDAPFSIEMWDYYLSVLNEFHLRYYPNNDHAMLLIEQFSGVTHNHLNLYDGSDRALRDIFMVFSVPGTEIVTTDPAFPMYKVYADMFGLDYVPVQYTETKTPVDGILASITDKTSLVVLSNPANPIGDILEDADFNRILDACKKHDCILVIDEAYIEFSTNTKTKQDLAKIDSNLIVVKTLSKCFGSAGARIGYAISSERNSAILEKATSMNYISAPSIIWLETVLVFKDELKNYYETVTQNRNILLQTCEDNNIDFLHSETNFVHIDAIIPKEKFIIKETILPWNKKRYARISVPFNSNTLYDLITQISRS